MQSSYPRLLKKEILKFSFITGAILLACFYFIFAVSLPNYRLIIQELVKPYSLAAKITIFSAIIQSSTSFNSLELFLLIINSFLVGASLVFLFRNIKGFKKSGKIKFSLGGAALVGMGVIGCGGCGFSILGIFGLTVSISFLPLKGLEFHLLSTLLLSLSLIYMVNKLQKEKYCKLK